MRARLYDLIAGASDALNDSSLWFESMPDSTDPPIIDTLLDRIEEVLGERVQWVIDASSGAIDDLKAEIADLKDQMKEMRHEACDREREMQRELRDALAEARCHEENQ